jgi:predicted membrane chloride channel (bestrophin family)
MIKVPLAIKLNKWIDSRSSRWSLGSLTSLVALLGAYIAIVAHGLDSLRHLNLIGVEEIYSTTNMIQGIVMGFYCSHVISRWWDLRVATGVVGGALTDTAMILRGYTASIKSDDMHSRLVNLGDKLKYIHMLHLSEVYGLEISKSQLQSLLALRPFLSSNSHDLVSFLSAVLEEITDLINSSPLSDAVKFSALPALQQNLSTIRSASGDCTMILNTQQPKSFTYFLSAFSLLNVVCFPVYIGTKTNWDPLSVVVAASIFFSIFYGFVIIVAKDFQNPFIINTFKIERIVAGTFQVVDSCLSLDTRTKRR